MRPEDKLLRALFHPDRDAPSARCPDCGIPTVPDHEGLTYEERLCESCYLRWSEEDHDR
jgi:NMD protein affecting ribosome stability and mRNA decay